MGGIELLTSLTAAISFPSIGQVIDHLHIRKQNLSILKTFEMQTNFTESSKRAKYLSHSRGLPSLPAKAKIQNLKLKLERFKTSKIQLLKRKVVY